MIVWIRCSGCLCGISFTAERLNGVQFLTIRQFLSLVFAALVILLLVLALWP